MKLKFICIASGSSGNCFYLGTDEYGILIDAGIPVRTIKGALKDVGLDFERVMAVFVTHDHADHIKSLGTLGEKYRNQQELLHDSEAGVVYALCRERCDSPF